MKSQVKITDDRLEMTRYFDAPRDQVFEAWKETELIQQWWGCAQTSKVETTMDFRTGGSFTHIMHIEGAGRCPMTGQFDEVIEGERIAYHVDFEDTTAHVSVQFISAGGKTKLVLVQEGFPCIPDMDIRDIVSAGFSAAFDKLERLLETTNRDKL